MDSYLSHFAALFAGAAPSASALLSSSESGGQSSSPLAQATAALKAFAARNATAFAFVPEQGSSETKKIFVQTLLTQVDALHVALKASPHPPTGTSADATAATTTTTTTTTAGQTHLSAAGAMAALNFIQPALECLRLLSRERISLDTLHSLSGMGTILSVAEIATCSDAALSAWQSTFLPLAKSLSPAATAALLAALDKAAEEAVKCCVNAIYENKPNQALFVQLNGLDTLVRILGRDFATVPVALGLGNFTGRLLFMMTALNAPLCLAPVRDRLDGLAVLVRYLDHHIRHYAAVTSPQSSQTHPADAARQVQDAFTVESVRSLSLEALGVCAEILKIMYNLTTHWQNASENEDAEQRSRVVGEVPEGGNANPHPLTVEERQFAALVPVTRPFLYLSVVPGRDTGKHAETLHELQSHAINLLTNTPLGCTDILLLRSPTDPMIPHIRTLASVPATAATDLPVDTASGAVLDAAAVLGFIHFLSAQLYKAHTDEKASHKELLTPILMALRIYTRGSRLCRKYFKATVTEEVTRFVPAFADVKITTASNSSSSSASSSSSSSSAQGKTLGPEEGLKIKAFLIRLLTSHVTNVSALAGDVLLILCKGNMAKLVRMTGYGNAAGLLANRGLFGRPLDDRNAPMYSSDSDQEGEGEEVEDEEAGHQQLLRTQNINPITGKPFEDAPSGSEKKLSELTEEELEEEARKLGLLFEKLEKNGIIRVMGVDENNETRPLNFSGLANPQAQQPGGTAGRGSRAGEDGGDDGDDEAE